MNHCSCNAHLYHGCHTVRYTVNAMLDQDPSRTTGLRNRFVRDMNKRFNLIKKNIYISIVLNDCFGIQPNAIKVLSPIAKKAFEFSRDPNKVEGFMKWLTAEEEKGILTKIIRSGVGGIEGAWTDIYIDSAYAQGIRRARAALRKKGARIPTLESMPGGVRAMMNQPIHADRIGIIYSRTYEDLKSVTNVMNAQIRRRIASGLQEGLARGLAEGKNPRAIARELHKNVVDRVDKIGITRARMIARTEVMNAHNEASLAQYEQASQEIGKPIMVGVGLGPNPCPICVDLEAGGPYMLEAARGQLPAHPNCVCVHIPEIQKE